jgi:hypothetical protein
VGERWRAEKPWRWPRSLESWDHSGVRRRSRRRRLEPVALSSIERTDGARAGMSDPKDWPGWVFEVIALIGIHTGATALGADPFTWIVATAAYRSAWKP